MVDAWSPHDGVGENGRAHLGDVLRGGARARSGWRLHPIPRPRDRDPRGCIQLDACRRLPSCCLELSGGDGIAAPAEGGAVDPDSVEDDRKLAGESDLGFFHAMACRDPQGQAFSPKELGTLVSKMCAASYRVDRTMASPALVILPLRSTSPDWCRRGTRPK